MSSHTPNQDASIQTGLSALQNGNYTTAIDALEPLLDTPLSPSSLLKVQTGLIKAYQKAGQTNKAIQLCQTLSQSDSPKIQQWAQQILSTLSPPQEENEAGFTPLNQDVGFIPLNQDAGFTPLNQEVGFPLNQDADFIPTEQSTPAPSTAQPKKIPPPPPPKKPIPPSQPITPFVWQNAGRSQKNWKTLPALKLWPLYLLQLATIYATFWVIQTGLQLFMSVTNNILVFLPLLNPIQAFYQDQTLFVAVTLLIIFIASPWLIDKLLQIFGNIKPFSPDLLEKFSPEAVQLLQKIGTKNKLPSPTLKLLPIDIPLIFTYGNLPQTARIAVSQGLLNRLDDSEIAALYAAEIGHLTHWTFPLISWATCLNQIPYFIYWQVARWGQQWQNIPRWQAQFIFNCCNWIAAISYGIYSCVHLPALWLSRRRLYYSDRYSAQLTGNPNALTRALLKLAKAITETIQKNRQTAYLLESFDILMPLSSAQAVTVGAFVENRPVEPILSWDSSNPYRHWLAINNSHPPLGDRLNLLTGCARFWQLETELALLPPTKTKPKLQPLLLGAGPYVGILLGLTLAWGFWVVGWFGLNWRIRDLYWISRDFPWLLPGFLLVGFSLGTVWRNNAFFPDINPRSVEQTTPLVNLLTNPQALPLDSLPVRLEGKLLGRTGLLNNLGQDLILQTETGLVKLHCFTKLGPVGNLWHYPAPKNLLNQDVSITGWFRRGATPWVDVATLTPTKGKRYLGAHPYWSILCAGVATLWGIYLISRGGL